MHIKLTVSKTIKADIETVWTVWNDPKHIIKWCSGHPDWHTIYATNNLKKGGTITTRMKAKDGSAGFDMTNIYREVITHELIRYQMDDGRECKTTFNNEDGQVTITQSFDPENENTHEAQRKGWQYMLNNFKTHIENLKE